MATLDYTPILVIVGSLSCFGCLICTRILYKLYFPYGIVNMFADVSISEIRLERLEQAEEELETSIKGLSDRLSFHNRKRKGLETMTDQSMRLLKEERTKLLQRNAETDQDDINFGWDMESQGSGTRNTMHEDEKRDKKKSSKSQDADQDEDMWALWNKVREDKPTPTPGSKGGGNDMSAKAIRDQARVNKILDSKGGKQSSIAGATSPAGAMAPPSSPPPSGLSASAKERMEALRGKKESYNKAKGKTGAASGSGSGSGLGLGLGLGLGSGSGSGSSNSFQALTPLDTASMKSSLRSPPQPKNPNLLVKPSPNLNSTSNTQNPLRLQDPGSPGPGSGSGSGLGISGGLGAALSQRNASSGYDINVSSPTIQIHQKPTSTTRSPKPPPPNTQLPRGAILPPGSPARAGAGTPGTLGTPARSVASEGDMSVQRKPPPPRGPPPPGLLLSNKKAGGSKP